jgi:hypothetical protein
MQEVNFSQIGYIAVIALTLKSAGTESGSRKA